MEEAESRMRSEPEGSEAGGLGNSFKKSDHTVGITRKEHRTKDISELFSLRWVSFKLIAYLCAYRKEPVERKTREKIMDGPQVPGDMTKKELQN